MPIFKVVATRSVVQECSFYVEAEDRDLLEESDPREAMEDYLAEADWDDCSTDDDAEIDRVSELKPAELKRFTNGRPHIFKEHHFEWPREDGDDGRPEVIDPRQTALTFYKSEEK